MKALLLLVLACMTSPGGTQSDDPFLGLSPLVRRELVDGRPKLTVITEDSPAKELVRMIASAYELELVGLENVGDQLISVHLEGRDLNSVLAAVLGGLGLEHRRHGMLLEITPPLVHTSEELFAMAESAWTEFYLRFPNHALAPHAQFSRAEIKEKLKNYSAARDIYLKIAKDYPASDQMGPALLRAAYLSAQQGDSAQASQLLRRLSTMDVPVDLQAETRVELARVLITQGDPQQALNLLKSMEVDYPPTDEGEAAVRRLIRARALNKLGKYVDALREIDMLDRNFDDLATWEALHIRANAFDGMGLHADASRAWIKYATDAIGKDRADAFTSAARLALLANEELVVIFISEVAAKDGFDKGLEEYVFEAKQRLGLLGEDPKLDLSRMLAAAENKLEAGQVQLAANVLEPLFQKRSELSELPLRARLSVAWARCLENQEDLNTAIGLLAKERSNYEALEELALFDIAAAQLFEKHGLFVEATKAYQGEYGQ